MMFLAGAVIFTILLSGWRRERIVEIKKRKNKPNVQSCLGNFPCGIEGWNVSFELKWLQVLSSHGQDDNCDALYRL